MSSECLTITMNSPKSKRTRFSIAKKIEILELVKTGKSRSDLCRDFGIASSTLHQFIKDESKIRGEFDANKNSNRTLIRKSPFHDLEQALIKWVRTVRD